eukprot:1333560-Prorocentrum_lima.AAC.1
MQKGKVARVRFGNDDFRNDSSIHFAVNATGHRTLCDEADPRCLVKVHSLADCMEYGVSFAWSHVPQ